jgi:hypothetical protein
MPYYSAVVWLYHLQSSLFISFHTSNSNEIYNPVPFGNEAYQFQRKLWVNRGLTVWPVFIYVGDLMHPVSLIFQNVLLEYGRN